MDEINGVLARKWNMERVTCFISMDLHTSSDIKGAANVKRRTKQRLVEWNEGKFDMLGSSTIICAEAQMSRKWNGMNEKKRAKVFSRMICCGKIRAGIRYISEREKGDILMPGDADENTDDLIKETLAAKHSKARDVDVANLPDFAVFCCFILYCVVLYSVLYCVVLYYIVLYCGVLCSILLCSVLFCFVLFCSILLCYVLLCYVML